MSEPTTTPPTAKVVFIRELFKTIREIAPSKKALGIIAIFVTVAWTVNSGYVTVADVQALAKSAVDLIRASIPGGV